jgi:hypothetical protein
LQERREIQAIRVDHNVPPLESVCARIQSGRQYLMVPSKRTLGSQGPGWAQRHAQSQPTRIPERTLLSGQAARRKNQEGFANSRIWFQKLASVSLTAESSSVTPQFLAERKSSRFFNAN